MVPITLFRSLASLCSEFFGFLRQSPRPHPCRCQLAYLLRSVSTSAELIIIAIVLFSVLLNFLMEFQARHAVEEIRKQIAITAAVMRDGREQELPVAELVPGDIVRLKAGDLVPADARLLEVKDLHVRESALTGESLPVEKATADLAEGEARHRGREQQRLPGHCRSDGDRHRSHRLHGKRYRLWRDCTPSGNAAAGDRVWPRHTPLRDDAHLGDHACSSFSSCW